MNDLSRARLALEEQALACAAVRDGKLFYQSHDRGIRPLLSPMTKAHSFFAGAAVADRVIGKAAAMLLIDSGVKSVYGTLMSAHAEAVLTAAGIPYDAAEIVPYIVNRDQTGMCPMEQAVLAADDPADALPLLTSALAALQRTR